jgi:hypothetical protein
MNFVELVTRYHTMRWSVGSITTWFGTERRIMPMVVVTTALLALLFFVLDDRPPLPESTGC